jgi:hypothetical protein
MEQAGPRRPEEGTEGVTGGVYSLQGHVVWHEEEHDLLLEWEDQRGDWPPVAMMSGLLIRCDVARNVMGMTLTRSCSRCSP